MFVGQKRRVSTSAVPTRDKNLFVKPDRDLLARISKDPAGQTPVVLAACTSQNQKL
jgi:hypothetical protein